MLNDHRRASLQNQLSKDRQQKVIYQIIDCADFNAQMVASKLNRTFSGTISMFEKTDNNNDRGNFKSKYGRKNTGIKVFTN